MNNMNKTWLVQYRKVYNTWQDDRYGLPVGGDIDAMILVYLGHHLVKAAQEAGDHRLHRHQRPVRQGQHLPQVQGI